MDAKDWADARFLQALASNYPGQKVEEAQVVAKAPSEKDIPILQQQIQIQFTPGSDEIMPGSYLLLDKLGETMTSFGNTVLRVEGNTDNTGSPTGNMTLSERRAVAVKNYIVKNFPNIPPTRFQTIGRGQPTRSPRTRPRPGGSRTAAPTSRSFWRRSEAQSSQ